jgi:hypothetical protein
MSMPELEENISRCMRTDAERTFWDGATQEERDRFVSILKADGLGEAVKQVKKCASVQAESEL